MSDAVEKALHLVRSPVDVVVASRLVGTDSMLLVFVNGHFVAELSDQRFMPVGITFHSDKKKCVHEIQINEKVSFPLPIHLLFINDDENVHAHNLIMVDEHAEITILEEHCSLHAEKYTAKIVTEIHADSNAKIHYHKIQNESAQAEHKARIDIYQKRDSQVQTNTFAVGAKLGYEELNIRLLATGVECEANGLYFPAQDKQQLENHILIDHIAPQGCSAMYYKGMMDKKSRAVFNGKVHVHPDAQKTKALQANHNLLLSNQAEIDTRPQLEIYADDVKCAHGDTVGQLDDEALFYLRSRGIEKNSAMRILTHAFAADVLDRIKNVSILNKMRDLLTEKMVSDE